MKRLATLIKERSRLLARYMKAASGRRRREIDDKLKVINSEIAARSSEAAARGRRR